MRQIFYRKPHTILQTDINTIKHVHKSNPSIPHLAGFYIVNLVYSKNCFICLRKEISPKGIVNQKIR